MRTVIVLFITGVFASRSTTSPCGSSASDDRDSRGGTRIGPAGGVVEGPNGARIEIPEGALSEDVSIGIRLADSSDLEGINWSALDTTVDDRFVTAEVTSFSFFQPGASAPEEDDGVEEAGEAYEVTPHGQRFQAPVRVRVPYRNRVAGLGLLRGYVRTDDGSLSCSGKLWFEDDFKGSELDQEQWNTQYCEPKYTNGILNLQEGCLLPLLSRFSVPNGPICLEARWKIEIKGGASRWGAGFNIGFLNKDAAGPGFGVFQGTPLFAAGTGSDPATGVNCGAAVMVDMTEYHTYRLIIEQERVILFLDNQEYGAINSGYSCARWNNPEVILQCTWGSCYLDYIRILIQ